jgi:hypothetical protein
VALKQCGYREGTDRDEGKTNKQTNTRAKSSNYKDEQGAYAPPCRRRRECSDASNFVVSADAARFAIVPPPAPPVASFFAVRPTIDDDCVVEEGTFSGAAGIEASGGRVPLAAAAAAATESFCGVVFACERRRDFVATTELGFAREDLRGVSAGAAGAGAVAEAEEEEEGGTMMARGGSCGSLATSKSSGRLRFFDEEEVIP